MRLPTRFRVRTLMLVVALVALGFGAAFELRNHAKRDRLLKSESRLYEAAAWHWEQALVCRDSEGKRPYPPAARRKLFATRGAAAYLGNFRSWADESECNFYWARRLFDQADGQKMMREPLEARLLLP
jgi:hypothetical protein